MKLHKNTTQKKQYDKLFRNFNLVRQNEHIISYITSLFRVISYHTRKVFI